MRNTMHNMAGKEHLQQLGPAALLQSQCWLHRPQYRQVLAPCLVGGRVHCPSSLYPSNRSP
jgi:hypothetical protein